MNRQEYENKKIYLTKENCPFCTKLKKDEIIHQTQYWLVLVNLVPYFDEKEHFMTIPKRHVEFTYELTEEELKDYRNIELFMKKYFENKCDYFSFIRQTKSNKSVEHMHYHYLP